jgi:putative PIN family toxin of toxin-antitoxin system
MKPRPTLVLDTNIWIPAFLAHGPPSEIVRTAEDGLIQVFASLEMLDEINRVLQHEKIIGILGERKLPTLVAERVNTRNESAPIPRYLRACFTSREPPFCPSGGFQHP